MAVTRFDIQHSLDRDMEIVGYGFMRGFPASSATSNATSGVPTDGVKGFGPGAIFQNYKATTPGNMVYINIGTVSSSNWMNVA